MRLLYISPVIPALTGNGLAMRAGMILEALASQHEVSLLVKPLYPPMGPIPEFFARLCRQVAVGPEGYRGKQFDVVHVFRLASLPAAQAFLRRGFFTRRTQHHLDLDDIESETHRRIAVLCHANGEAHMATQEELMADISAHAEYRAFQKFQRIYLCSTGDREKIAARTAAEICVLPNAVRLPRETCAAPRSGPFLFIGTLGYYPNHDACRYLRQEIAPRLPGFEFQIVGTGATQEFRDLVAHPAIHVIGEVPEVAPWFQQAAALVVPVRAGGGTRIKILEAFSFRCPVITTSVGVEGIEARHDEHLLVADTPDEFARACRRIREEPDLGPRLAGQAFNLLTRLYSAEAARKTIAGFSWTRGRRGFRAVSRPPSAT